MTQADDIRDSFQRMESEELSDRLASGGLTTLAIAIAKDELARRGIDHNSHNSAESTVDIAGGNNVEPIEKDKLSPRLRWIIFIVLAQLVLVSNRHHLPDQFKEKIRALFTTQQNLSQQDSQRAYPGPRVQKRVDEMSDEEVRSNIEKASKEFPPGQGSSYFPKRQIADESKK